MNQVINIPAIFQKIIDLVDEEMKDFDVHFKYGHYTEITRALQSMDRNQETQVKKYPLVWLVMDFVERHGGTSEYCELSDVTLIIATTTPKNISTAERFEKNFLPVLYPIYESLMRNISDSGFFSWAEIEIPHEKIDRPYWDGKENQGAANFFADFIDAIQIRRMKLIVNLETCDQFKLIAA